MIKISSIVVTLLTTASIVWDATSRARTGAAQIPRPGTSLYAHGVASMSTTQGIAHKIKTGQNLGGGRVSIKAAGEGQNAVGNATLSTAGSLGQNVGGGRVRFKTVGVGQGAGSGAILGTVNDGGQIAGHGRVTVKTVGVGQRLGGGETFRAVSSWGQSAGGGRVQVKTVGLGQDAGRDASLGTADDVWQGLGGGRVRVKTVGVGQSLDRDATHGTVDDEIAYGGARYGGSADLGTNGSTPLIEARWRSANGLFTVKPRRMELEPPVRECVSRGFHNYQYSCVCNFAGACDKNNQPVPWATNELTGFAPEGVEEIAYGRLVKICEKNTVGILFDCDGRIPLYAATVIDGRNLGGKISRKNIWRKTWDDDLKKVKRLYVGGNKDYEQSSCIVYCYEDGESQTFKAWDGRTSCANSLKIPEVIGIDRGHMIAARYGYGHEPNTGVEATFTYTNAVPQIASFNSGAWAQGEDKVIKFAKNCKGKVYVVVGTIPTSFIQSPRFFGKGGFSNFQDDKHRILVPLIMWTAGCCINHDGSYRDKFAFYGRNLKINQKGETFEFKSASEMFKAMNTDEYVSPSKIPNIEVFPAMTDCN